MAGQPPEHPYQQPAEPSFQPAGQDHNTTQGRPAWQPPAYNPPAGGGGQHGYGGPAYGAPDQGYAAPPPPAEQTFVAPPLEQQPGYGAPDQGYAGPDQGYGAPDQGYAGPDQGYQGQGTGQNYPGYQPPGYGAHPGQPGQGAAVPPPQWQATPSPARPQRSGERGFVGSLLDFSFTSFVTPKIIKILYVLFTVWTALVAVIIAVVGFETGGVVGGIFTVVVVDSVFVLLSLGIYRVVLEAFMVVHRIYDETKRIRENAASEN